MTHTCPQCERLFEPKRPHAVCCSDPCRYQHWIEQQVEEFEARCQRVKGHVLDDARGQVEEGKTASEWALIAREQVMRTLLGTGFFTADDLAELGIPEHYRRSVHGLVTAHFRGPEPYMEEAGRRKSERPERKGAKNTVFRITAKGRRELPAKLRDLTSGVDVEGERLHDDPLGVDPGGESAGVCAEGQVKVSGDGGITESSPALSADPGEQSRPTLDAVALVQAEGSCRTQVRDGVESSGKGSPAGSQAAGESCPTLFDASEARERPRSAWTDGEMAA